MSGILLNKVRYTHVYGGAVVSLEHKEVISCFPTIFLFISLRKAYCVLFFIQSFKSVLFIVHYALRGTFRLLFYYLRFRSLHLTV
jgi:hypothetical protein